MKRRLISLLIIFTLVLSIAPCAFADEAISKVSIRIYPDSSYGYDNNQDPLVGEDASYIYALISNGEVTLSNGDYYLMDGGARASGAIKDQNYTFFARVYAVGGYVMNEYTTASVNNEAAYITVAPDGLSADITITVTPRVEGPAIYKSPSSETHPAGETFFFTASAGNYDTFQWYIRTPYNIDYKAEDAYDKVGLYATVQDCGTYVNCNLHTVSENFNGWRVYCVFTGKGGENLTSMATVNVTGAPDPYTTPTPEATSQIWIVDTPEPTSQIWIVETPTPEIIVVETPEPTVEPTAEPVKTSDHKGLKIAGGVIGGILVLGGGLIGTQYFIDKKKRKQRAQKSKSNYKGKH